MMLLSVNRSRALSMKTRPPPGTLFWGSRMKAAVVMAIRDRLITRQEAYEQYDLSPEELASWEAAFDRGGQRALSDKAMLRHRRRLKTLAA